MNDRFFGENPFFVALSEAYSFAYLPFRVFNTIVNIVFHTIHCSRGKMGGGGGRGGGGGGGGKR
jgi:hypothetical protein